VTHSSTGRSRDTSDEADNGLTTVDSVGLLEELGGVLLGRTTNLTNHDDTVGVGVLSEDLEAVDEVGTGEGVTANSDNERLTKTGLGGLVDGLVSESTGTRDDTDAAALVDEARHDTNLALFGGDDTGAVGSDETSLALGLEHVGDANHVVLGDTLSDADNEGDLGLESLLDTGGGQRRTEKNC